MRTTIEGSGYPVVLFMYNRPAQAARTIDAIGKVRPQRLFVVGDGPREDRPDDRQLVAGCRELIGAIDWPCDVVTNFAERNLGCMRRVTTGIDWVFEHTEAAIFLEDDCCPTGEFFEFVEWGLSTFKDDVEIGMISGSNLIDHLHRPESRNGFSELINIWGWATWKRVWKRHSSTLSLHQIHREKKQMRKARPMPKWEAMFWTQLFKNTAYFGSTWDFQLQYTFFLQGLRAVYPRQNLVLNTGYDEVATHTAMPAPRFVIESRPAARIDLMAREPDLSREVDRVRDRIVARTIWSCDATTAARLWLTNFFRLVRV